MSLQRIVLTTAVAIAVSAMLAGCQLHVRRTNPGRSNSASYNRTTRADPAPVVQVSAHNWRYYSDSEVYHCGTHSHWSYYSGGGWVVVQSLPTHIHVDPRRGRNVAVQHTGARPYTNYRSHRNTNSSHHEHSWVFYPGNNVYHCHVHDHYMRRNNGAWATVNSRPAGTYSSGVRLTYYGSTPHHDNSTHRTTYSGRTTRNLNNSGRGRPKQR